MTNEELNIIAKQKLVGTSLDYCPHRITNMMALNLPVNLFEDEGDGKREIKTTKYTHCQKYNKPCDRLNGGV